VDYASISPSYTQLTGDHAGGISLPGKTLDLKRSGEMGGGGALTPKSDRNHNRIEFSDYMQLSQ